MKLPVLFLWDEGSKKFIVPDELKLPENLLKSIESYPFIEAAINALLKFKQFNLFPGDVRARHIGLMFSDDKIIPVIIDTGTSFKVFPEDDYLQFIFRSGIYTDTDFGDAFTEKYQDKFK